jgi:hypothetical protein
MTVRRKLKSARGRKSLVLSELIVKFRKTVCSVPARVYLPNLEVFSNIITEYKT